MKKFWDDELRITIAVQHTDCMGKKFWSDEPITITAEDIWHSSENWVAEINNIRIKGRLGIDKQGLIRETTYHVTAQCINKKSDDYKKFYTTRLVSAR